MSEPEMYPLTKDWLQDVSKEVGASDAVYLSLRYHNSETTVERVVQLGKSRAWRRLENGHLPAGFDSDFTDAAIRMRRGQWCLQAPLERHNRHFSWFDDELSYPSRWQNTAAYKTLYEPNGYVHQARMILVQDEFVLGWCAFFWDQLRSKRRTMSVLEKRVTGLLDLVPNQPQNDDIVHRYIFEEDGNLLAHNVSGSNDVEIPVLEPETIWRYACRNSKNVFLQGWELECHPLEGEAGELFIAVARPADLVPVRRTNVLTQTQSKIALLVAEGCPNDEIAAICDVSSNTVKYHLKNVYSLLQISSRAELTVLLSNESLQHYLVGEDDVVGECRFA